jgi:soluble lytic murein transglycosylase-like protein
VAVVPVTATAAYAKTAPAPHARIQLMASVQDHPENFRAIPADPPPAPAQPAPTAAPKIVAKPVVYAPRPVVVPSSRAQIADVIRAAAARYGVNPDTLLRVAMCESGLNPYAANASGAQGLFQFKSATFYGHGGHNIWDPADQADVAARMFSQGQARQWTCK